MSYSDASFVKPQSVAQSSPCGVILRSSCRSCATQGPPRKARTTTKHVADFDTTLVAILSQSNWYVDEFKIEQLPLHLRDYAGDRDRYACLNALAIEVVDKHDALFGAFNCNRWYHPFILQGRPQTRSPRQRIWMYYCTEILRAKGF